MAGDVEARTSSYGPQTQIIRPNRPPHHRGREEDEFVDDGPGFLLR